MVAIACMACGGATTGRMLEPLIQIDGSSAIYPLSEPLAEEFQNKNQNIRVTVNTSGTAKGLERFCRGEIDVTGAARPMKTPERDSCTKAGMTFFELPVAYDGLVTIVNPRNTWADRLTVAELKRLWEPGAEGKISRWSQVRAGWPERNIHLNGPATDSDTYEYFTGAIIGGVGRRDFTSSEDEASIASRVADDELALGIVSYVPFDRHKQKLKSLPVDDGNEENGVGAIAPGPETVRGGTYQPLSRPFFLYVSRKALERSEVKAFVDYYLKEGPWIIDQAGGIQLGDKGYEIVRERFARGVTGSVFDSGGSQIGLTLDQLLARQH